MSVVDDYLETVSAPEKAQLERICKIVHATLPDVQEVKSYGMPAFRYQGKYLVAFYAFKDHLSLFPTSGPVEAVKDRLAGFKWFKGTIQFTPDHPLPEALIKDIVLARAAAIAKH